MTLVTSDREKQTIIAALQFFLNTKQVELKDKTYVQRNEFDILSPAHSVMHSLALLKTITKQPMEYFMNALQQTPPSPDAEPSQPTPPETTTTSNPPPPLSEGAPTNTPPDVHV